MLLYENTKGGFVDDVLEDRVVDEIKQSYRDKGLHIGTKSEVRSWRNSLQYMYRVLNSSDVPDEAGVAIEFKIPLTSRRVDFMISGFDEAGDGNVVVIELKQWDGTSTRRIEDADGVIDTYVGGGVRTVAHPSYQAWSYCEFLRDFNVSIEEGDIDLHPVAYLHNYQKEYREQLESGSYTTYTEQAPLYLKGDAKKLRAYLERQIKEGDDRSNIYEIEDGDIRPSKSLQDALHGMLDSRDEFTLIDTQKVVFEKAVSLAKQSYEDDQKRVLIVEGGPGTGKTVVAINILAELIGSDIMAQYVSKNSAPRTVYQEKLKGEKSIKEIKNLFTGSGGFYEAEGDSIPALITDEAHRLNEESGFYGNKGENQIMEIINAAKFSIFFIDESQRVHIDDIGSKDEIREHADKLGAEVTEVELQSQFRCNGEEGYIAWLDHVLGIRETANADGFDLDYDLRIFGSPGEMHRAIRERDAENRLARVVAGYCWDWDTDERDNPDHYDIKIGDYEKSWNLEGGDHWAIDEGSLEEVGCIHTCQGLEFDYVGVIIGPDMKYRDGEIVVDFNERYSHDSSIKGLKKMMRENPEEAKRLEDEIIKNTYRTLMSRGMKGCYIYCCDDRLQEYLQERIAAINSSASR